MMRAKLLYTVQYIDGLGILQLGVLIAFVKRPIGPVLYLQTPLYYSYISSMRNVFPGHLAEGDSHNNIATVSVYLPSSPILSNPVTSIVLPLAHLSLLPISIRPPPSA